MARTRYLLAVVTFVILSGTYCVEALADISYADLFLAGRGYKPVEDNRVEYSGITFKNNRGFIPDNQLYKEWCINTFNNGEQIYEAYKEIAFDINYRVEPPKTDYWQTPIETQQSKQGDCEDSVFLFFSKLAELDINGNIIWGWVVEKDSAIAFAHVWYQLFDKHGKAYIVEGFSKEWNGIIPVEMLRGTEERVSTLIVRHNKVCHVVDDMLPKPALDTDRGFPEPFEEAQFPRSIYLSNTTFIKEILQKLHEMFARYKRQTHPLF